MELYLEGNHGLDEKELSLSLQKLNQELNLDLEQLSIHFLSDEGLLEINRKYLNHDYYTDIITFDLRDEISNEAELYLSLDRIYENAEQNKQTKPNEMLRVIVHGMLHLGGFKDSTDEEKNLMRSKENEYLNKVFHVKQI